MPWDFCPISQASINYIICGKSGSVMHTTRGGWTGRVKMAPPIITCPRREWGVSGWFISEYIIRFRFYVDGRRPFVRPADVTDKLWLWRQNVATQRNMRVNRAYGMIVEHEILILLMNVRIGGVPDLIASISIRVAIIHFLRKEVKEEEIRLLSFGFSVTWFARRKSLRNGNGSFPVSRDEYFD